MAVRPADTTEGDNGRGQCTRGHIHWLKGDPTLSIVVFVARLILSALFVAAGIGKLRDLPGTRRAVTEFGVPRGLIRLTAIILPMLETGIGLSLLSAESAPAGATAGAALLLAFMAAMIANLARGRRPDCHCLGQIYSEPVGPAAIARTLVLIGIATFVALAGRRNAGPGIVEPIAHMGGTAQLAIEIAVTAAAILLVQGLILHRIQHGREEMLDRLQWLENLVGAGNMLGPSELPDMGRWSGLDGDDAPGDERSEPGIDAEEAAE